MYRAVLYYVQVCYAVLALFYMYLVQGRVRTGLGKSRAAENARTVKRRQEIRNVQQMKGNIAHAPAHAAYTTKPRKRPPPPPHTPGRVVSSGHLGLVRKFQSMCQNSKDLFKNTYAEPLWKVPIHDFEIFCTRTHLNITKQKMEICQPNNAVLENKRESTSPFRVFTLNTASPTGHGVNETIK